MRLLSRSSTWLLAAALSNKASTAIGRWSAGRSWINSFTTDLPAVSSGKKIFVYMFIIDAHLDLSMNAMEWNRDLRLPVQAIRDREKGLTDKPDRGKGTVSLPEMRKGRIGLCVATQIGRYVGVDNSL